MAGRDSGDTEAMGAGPLLESNSDFFGRQTMLLLLSTTPVQGPVEGSPSFGPRSKPTSVDTLMSVSLPPSLTPVASSQPESSTGSRANDVRNLSLKVIIVTRTCYWAP